MSDSGSGIRNISPEEKQKAIEQFCTFTGVAENRAKETLETCNWNIELAVSVHVDSIKTGGAVDKVETSESSSLPVSDNNPTSGQTFPSSTISSSSSFTNTNTTTSTPSITPSSASSGMLVDKLLDSFIGSASSSKSPSPSPSTSNTLETSSGISTPFTSLLNEDDSFRPSVDVPTPRHAPSLDELANSLASDGKDMMYSHLKALKAVTGWLEKGESGTSSASTANQNKRRTLEDLFRPPLDLMFRGSNDQSGDPSEDTEAPGSKRPVTASTSSEDNNANISTSPPRFMALEEIMKAANEVCNMCLAHEIAMDNEFKLEKTETPPNSLRKQVDFMMRKVFWELLQNELDESPSNFKRALMLLSEIKENLMSFLLPQHTRLKQEIEEILDLDLIKQQAENGALDFQRYAHYILSVMARLCAPIRDEKIRQLTQTREVVPIFRGIMELLDEMRLDMANFLVQQIRPQILQQSVTYERKKFTKFLERRAIIDKKTDTLEFTRKWLKRVYEENDFTGESTKEIINKVLTSAYVQLLVWDESIQSMFPETLLLDEKRIISLRDYLTLNIFVGSALLITVAAFPSVQSLSELKETIRDHLILVLDEKEETTTNSNPSLSSSSTSSTTSPSADLESRLESAALQIISDIKKYADKHNFPEIDSTKESALKAQIIDLTNKDNRIRQIVQRRILEFVESVFTSNTASPVQMPKGLTALQKGLSSIAGQFMRIASHNRAVYGDYYVDIITDLVNGKL